MSEQWRILVVEDDEQVNQSTVNSLCKDGYLVRGVNSGAEAIRILWREEYDVVIGDLKMPGADGLEMLQWLRAYRPYTHMIMVAADASPASRTSALEGGVVSYLQEPLDLHLLKEELRRLHQQTGFSASLDSFDLLDVIQIITMSRKNIALMVNTGPEERGILCFQGGELVWAEYGTLRGEEAFFALAAYKNGTVTQQAWHEQVTPNVTQPLSRLIFQALHYRSKYSALQASGKHEALPHTQHLQKDDDRPFLVLPETQPDPLLIPESASVYRQVPGESNESSGHREWWQPTDKITGFPLKQNSDHLQAVKRDSMETPATYEQVSVNNANDASSASSSAHKTPASQRTDLPSWLTDLPAKFDMSMKSDMPIQHPSSLSHSAKVGAVPSSMPAPAEWQSPEQANPAPQPGQPLQILPAAPKSGDVFEEQRRSAGGPAHMSAARQTGKLGAQRATRRNYPALVSALQTIGYSIAGFIAVAVVSLDGQPIAQVAIDDLDISPTCVHFSRILQGALQSLADGQWGKYEDTVITSGDRYILLRIIDNDKQTFQVLITTRESNPAESLEVMANVEGTIGTALH